MYHALNYGKSLYIYTIYTCFHAVLRLMVFDAGVGAVRSTPDHEVGYPRRRHRRSVDREHEHRYGRQQGAGHR